MEDLTNRVRIVGKFPFALSGNADIWKGEMVGSENDRNSKEQDVLAVKIIRSHFGDANERHKWTQRFHREAELWTSLGHPNVLPFFGISYDFQCGSHKTPCLVSPFRRNGNIQSYLEKEPTVNRIKLVSQVAAGLAYLHKRRIVHGDLKASNILINDDGMAELCDFGLSRIDEANGYITKTMNGTCRWMAPELLLPDSGNDWESTVPAVTYSTDVWAFGMTALEILTGKLPFYDCKYDTVVILSLVNGSRPKHTSYPDIRHDIWPVLEYCWEQDPLKRPSIGSLSLFFDIINIRRTALTWTVLECFDIIMTQSGSPLHRLCHVEGCTSHPGTRDLLSDRRSKEASSLAMGMPFRCQLPGCPALLVSLSKCQAHENRHFELRRGSVMAFNIRRTRCRMMAGRLSAEI